jgi:Family of unknown function (DUF5338)
MTSYKEKLIKRMSAGKKKNLASFLAIKSDITEALDEKIPMTVIHSDLVETGKISFGYVQFTSYVKKHIRQNSIPVNLKTEPGQPSEIKTKEQEREEFASQYLGGTNPYLKKLLEKKTKGE